VRSMDLMEAKSPWSKVNMFTVNQFNESPNGPVQLIAPLDLSEITSNDSFLWKTCSDPDPGDSVYYVLEIDQSPLFNPALISITVLESESKNNLSNSRPDLDIIGINLNNIPGKTRFRDNQMYYWRVLAVDTSNISSSLPDFPNRFIFNEKNDPPGMVQSGFSPSGGEIINTRSPIIYWDLARDPDFSDLQLSIAYEIELSRDALFSKDSTYLFTTPISVNQYQIPVQLDENKKWFYRIKSVDSHGATSDWSSLNSFITNEILESPTVISSGFFPKDSVIVNTPSPILSWLPPNDPDPDQTAREFIYQVRYFLTDKPDSYYYASSEKGVTSVHLSFLNEDCYYGYQISASDKDGITSSWSQTQYFGVNTVDNPPNYFQLISPYFNEDSIQTDVSFQWQQSTDQDLSSTIKYILYYGTDSLFLANTYKIPIAAKDSSLVIYSPVTPLERQQKYFWRVVAIDNNRNETWGSESQYQPFVFTTIGYQKNVDQSAPTSFALYQNYPNPFNRITTIRYEVADFGPLDVTIYDILGKRIRTLANGNHSPGIYEVMWDGTDSAGAPVPGGMYLCRMNARNFIRHKKVLLMK